MDPAVEVHCSSGDSIRNALEQDHDDDDDDDDNDDDDDDDNYDDDDDDDEGNYDNDDDDADLDWVSDVLPGGDESHANEEDDEGCSVMQLERKVVN